MKEDIRKLREVQPGGKTSCSYAQVYIMNHPVIVDPRTNSPYASWLPRLDPSIPIPPSVIHFVTNWNKMKEEKKKHTENEFQHSQFEKACEESGWIKTETYLTKGPNSLHHTHSLKLLDGLSPDYCVVDNSRGVEAFSLLTHVELLLDEHIDNVHLGKGIVYNSRTLRQQF